MKRLASALAVVPLTALLAACGGGNTGTAGDAATGTEADGTTVIQAGSTGQSYPNSYQEDGELIGYDVEVIETAAENLGYEVEWTNADFSGIMGQLEAGRLDTVANNVAVTEERSQAYDFTAPYAYMGATIVTHESNDDINALQDLDGGTVAGVLGSNNLVHLEAWEQENGVDVEVRTYETRDGAMQDVLNGRVDGYINSTGVFLSEIERTGAPLKFVGEPIAWEEVALPFAQDSQYTEEFSAQIEQMREDGTLTELSEQYFGADVSAAPEGFGSESAGAGE